MIDFGTWKKAWALLDGRERRYAVLVLFVLIVAAFFSAAMVGSILPFLTVLGDPAVIGSAPLLALAYDAFGFTSTYDFILVLGAMSLGVIALASLAQILRAYAIAVFTSMRVESLSNRLLAAYLGQPYEFFLDQHSGDLGTKILAECQIAVDQFFRPAAEIVAATFSALAVFALVLWMAPLLAIGCLVVLGGIYGMTYYLTRRRIARLAESRFAANKARFRICSEALGGIKHIKILGREQSFLDRFKRPSRDLARAQATTSVTAEVPNFVLQGLAFGGVIALGLYLLEPDAVDAQNAFGGILPLAGLFAFAGQRLIPELQRIYAGFTQMQQGHLAVAAIHRDLIQNRVESAPTGVGQPALGLRRQVELQDVSYRYPNADQAGLSNISLTISAGEKIGVVGATGAGKSTLADLLLGLISPVSGRVVVDGVAITPDNIRGWRASLGYVPQDIFLVDASIRENIALGLPAAEIDQKRVIEACQIAQLRDWVEQELPQGYDTPIGERGVRLSGGQRQRIGIARAVYRNASLLIFDEATSALDNLTEQEVISAVNALPGDKTIVTIAHRLTTVKGCDRILLLDKGELVAQGPWERLMSDNAFFRQFVNGRTDESRQG